MLRSAISRPSGPAVRARRRPILLWPWRRSHPPSRGQALVEFALVIPIFLLVFISLIEFAMLLNANLAINFASREASLEAAEAGDAQDADCIILRAIERSVVAPTNAGLITQVRIFEADRQGIEMPGRASVYTRTGSTTCVLPDTTTVTVPYSIGAAGYQPATRCNMLAGCGNATALIDQVGVEISYLYHWHTPLGNLIGGSGGAPITLVKGNVMRMEPVL